VRENKKADINQLENQKTDLQTEIRNQEERERARLVPEIERYREMIEKAKRDISTNEQELEREAERETDLQVKVEKLEEQREELKSQHNKLLDDFLN
jgi:chromosome segregation ATPase